jgi:hypothetical protein
MEIQMSKPIINLSPEAKRRLQTERRRIARDQSKSALVEMEKARGSLRSDSRNQRNRTKESQGIAIIRNLVSLCRAVNASFGVSVPIHMGEAPVGSKSPVAYTDGTKIVVKYPMPVTADEAGNTVYINDIESLKRLVSEVKALQYHELGHILFSQHINWMMADCGYGNEEWVKKYPTLSQETATSVRRAWNILEDQRMETALVAQSPYLARYLTYLSVNWILNEANWSTDNGGIDKSSEKGIACQYLLVINRRFLPIELRRKSRNNFNTYFGDHATVSAEEVVREYCRATSVEDKVVAVIKFHQLLKALDIVPPQFDDHTGHPRNGKRPVQDSADSADDQDEDGKEITKGKSKDKTEPKDDAKGDDESEGSGSGDPHEGDDDAQDGEGSSADGDNTNDSVNESSSNADDDGKCNNDGDANDDGEGGGAGGDGGTEKPQQDADDAGTSEDDTTSDLKELLDEIENEIHNDSDIEDTVRAINEDFNRGDIKQLAPELSGTAMDDEGANRARDIAYRLGTAFDSASSSALPIWEEGHREGVINAFRYRTRNAGDNEYRRTLTSTGNTGLDIAVTLMLDTSGSMSSVGRELGVSGFAVKEACDQVGIDCTVVTFDSDSQELWRAIDRHVEPVALKPGGGTNPISAFNVLDSHREEQKYHLVIILTDGVWNGDVKCHDYASDGRVFLGVAFGAEVDTAYLLRVGCDQVVNIDTIEQLPEVVRNFLLNFLG